MHRPHVAGGRAAASLLGLGLLVVSSTARAGSSGQQAIVLTPPQPIVVTPMRLQAAMPEPEHSGTDRVFVRVTDFDTPVYINTARATWGLGVLRRGTVLPAEPFWGDGCTGGRWAKLHDGGVVCHGDGVEFLGEVQVPETVTLAPDLSAPLPYRYAKVSVDGAPIFDVLPTAAQAEAIARGERVRGLSVTPKTGIKFIAVDRPHTRDGKTYLRSVAGEYVPVEATTPISVPRTHGQPLEESKLPLAFVIENDAPVWELGDDGSLQQVGVAKRTARFDAGAPRDIDEKSYVSTAEGLLVAREHVRLVEAIAPPSQVPDGAKWIHVDLDEQTLTAYEGTVPVYATLVATGISGYDTPTGAWRIRRKYISRRMQGPDPDKGTYDIEEVPWAMYYHRGYALHGAYWHDEFGQVRSHGCTNLPPVDARWLFSWADPQVPDGWQGVHWAGTWVVITKD